MNKYKDSNKHKKTADQKNITHNIEKGNTNNWPLIALTIVIIITFFIYFKALKFNLLYSWDDQVYIRNNVDITGLNWTNIKLFFTKFYSGNYHFMA